MPAWRVCQRGKAAFATYRRAVALRARSGYAGIQMRSSFADRQRERICFGELTSYNNSTTAVRGKENGMTVLEYNDLLEHVSHLSQQEKANLLVELATQVRDDRHQGKKRSIMELEGLGKEIWVGIDAKEYVNRERDSWNG
jgi:hypothetical protein